MIWNIIVGIILVIIGGTVAKILVEELFYHFSGKKVVIIGDRHTGKTKMWEFLSRGTISSKYIQTQSPEKFKIGEEFPLKELNLRLKKEQIDLPGGWDFRGVWLEEAKRADYVFYLFRLPCVYKQSDCNNYCPFKSNLNCEGKIYYIKKMEIILKELERESLVKKTVLVGTFADYIPQWVELEGQGKDGGFYEIFINSLDYTDLSLLNLIKKFKITFGSLRDKNTAERLVMSVFIKAMGKS